MDRCRITRCFQRLSGVLRGAHVWLCARAASPSQSAIANTTTTIAVTAVATPSMGLTPDGGSGGGFGFGSPMMAASSIMCGI
jgi:hypothetical protein